MTTALLDAPTEPRILRVSAIEDGCEISLLIPPDLPFFRGHFDGFPILPGVVQLDWALRLAARHLPIAGLRPARMQLKFQHPIRPGARPSLTLTLIESEDRRQLLFAYRDGSTPCSS